jgi:hypothetical protein
MCAQGRGRGSGAIFSRKKGTEIFIRFLRAVLKSCLLNPSYRPRDDKEERGAPVCGLLLFELLLVRTGISERCARSSRGFVGIRVVTFHRGRNSIK